MRTFGILIEVIIGVSFMILFAVLLFVFIRQSFKETKTWKRIQVVFYSLFSFVIFVIAINMTIRLINLLLNYDFVEGTTIEYCSTRHGGQGVVYEYCIGGEKYNRCESYAYTNTIKVPGGKFKVRVSKFNLEYAVIYYDNPITKESYK